MTQRRVKWSFLCPLRNPLRHQVCVFKCHSGPPSASTTKLEKQQPLAKGKTET